MSLRGFACSRHGRHCASRLRAIRPAPSSTFKCLDTAGRLISKGLAKSVTEVWPEARRARMARLVGSTSAAKVELRRPGDMVRVLDLTNRFNKKCHTLKRPPIPRFHPALLLCHNAL